MEEITLDDILNMENAFYTKPFRFSYSSLNKLMWNPQAFYQMYVLGNREEKTESYLVNGKIVHALLLEEEKFNDQFSVSPTNLPTGNTRVLVDRIYAHAKELQASGDTRTEFVDFSDAVLDVLVDMNLHQSLKTDQQRLDKIFTVEAINYWNFLSSSNGKTIIDKESYDFCKTGVDMIKLNKDICELIACKTNEFSNIEVFNELYLEADLNNKPFGIKGIIDNLVIDHDKKTINVNDIKTTSKELKDFPESIDFYNYWMQAAIYASIVGMKYTHLVDQGYIFNFNFVVIDRNYQVYPFKVTQKTMNVWFDKLIQAMDKAEWHYKNKNFTLPYDFATGAVSL